MRFDDDFRDAHERAFRDHILAAGPEGWPHVRGNFIPGEGQRLVDACDDLCSDAILDRLEEMAHDDEDEAWLDAFMESYHTAPGIELARMPLKPSASERPSPGRCAPRLRRLGSGS